MALYLDIFICSVGLSLHFAMKWGEARQIAGSKPPGLVEYIKAVPAQSLVSLLATVGVFTVMEAMDWMNPGAAFTSGYLGNSLAENLANRFAQLPK